MVKRECYFTSSGRVDVFFQAHKWGEILGKEGSEMEQNGGADGASENWEPTKDMLLEDQTPRKASKRAALSFLPSSPQRAVVLLALLLALSFVFLMALTIVNIRRVSVVREELEQAQLREKQNHVTAWHNLTKVQQALETQLSAELRLIHSRLLNVSRQVEDVQREMAQCRAECGKELRDRIRALEGREALQPALQQLEELKQEQSHISTLLNTALEETQNLTEMFCTRCPAGWQQFAKTCYYFSTEEKSWIEARAACSMLGAQLAVVNSELENKFLANHIMEIRAFWLGLNDMQREGDWEWLDGQSLSISFWRKGEPNNVGQHGEDCATVSSSGLWNDVTCTSTEAWICERSC